MKLRLSHVGSAVAMATLVVATIWAFRSISSQGSGGAVALVSPLPTPTQAAVALPTPTRNWALPTGGPYISEAEALAKGLAVASFGGGRVDETIGARAIFTTVRYLNAIAEKPAPPVNSDREIWVVTAEGRFYQRSIMPGAKVPPARTIFVVMDATSGEITSVGLRGVAR